MPEVPSRRVTAIHCPCRPLTACISLPQQRSGVWRSLGETNNTLRAGEFRGERDDPASCISCDVKGDEFYQDKEGQAQCEKCPPNTRRYLQQGNASSVKSCQCKENFWRHDKQSGFTCWACPTGGTCLVRCFPSRACSLPCARARTHTDEHALIRTHTHVRTHRRHSWGEPSTPNVTRAGSV